MNRKEAIKKWEEIVQETETKGSELDNLLGAARQSNNQTTNILNDAKNKLNEVVSIENQINQKLQTINQSYVNVSQKEEEAKNKLEAISQVYTETENKKTEIEELKSETEELLKKNNEQSEKISDLLQKAAAGSLFNSFNVRKQEFETASRFWRLMVGASVMILVLGATYVTWLAQKSEVLSYAFILKFSVSLPVIYWLIFATRQYVKNKRLEEEYAFKSAISLSLEAYRDLIKKESGEPTKQEVVPFITEAVGKIFSSPSVIIAKNPHKEDSDLTESILDKLLQLIGKIKG